MEPTVSVASFEGPLGLLLELVERNKLEITTISIAAITQQYLSSISALELVSRADLAQFVALGARLLFIKSAALLPASENEPSPQAELTRLGRELDEYRQMRDAARQLDRHLKATGRCYSRPIKAIRATTALPLPSLELELLQSAFQTALAQTKPVATLSLERRSFDQVAIMKSITHRLINGTISLQSIISDCDDRLEIIVTFVALLELVKSGDVRVRQSQIFDAIHLELTND